MGDGNVRLEDDTDDDDDDDDDDDYDTRQNVNRVLCTVIQRSEAMMQ